MQLQRLIMKFVLFSWRSCRIIYIFKNRKKKALLHNLCFISLKGNKLTLETRPSKDGIDIRQELLQFHSTYYSSNLMGLCVLGRGKS